jgi:UDPglucose 6-dehydrogenase
MRSAPRRRGPRIGVAGLGYMGLASGLAFAARGLEVIGYDVKPVIRSAVRRGSTPYAEAGLEELLRSQLRTGRFTVVDSVDELVRSSEAIFLCVPTPSRRSGGIDLGPLKQSAREIGQALRAIRGYRLVVVKSTVVPGTTDGVVAPIVRRASGRSVGEVGVACNPEFLAEGSMVHDALEPDRIVLGTSDGRTLQWLRRAYRAFPAPVFALPPAGAELVKYGANSFLALKVSYANELGRIADRVGVNIDAVVAAIGHDPRIGERFLRAGPGFGGSCFDKDVRALVARSGELGVAFRAGEAALRINYEQLDYVLDLVRASVGPLRGKRVALLGLSFKAGTDDVRESRALPIAQRLLAGGASVRAHDPVALRSFARAWSAVGTPRGRRLQLVPSVRRALAGADAAILQADWPEYGRWTVEWTRTMRHPILVDLRRFVRSEVARRAGLRLVGLGAGSNPERS